MMGKMDDNSSKDETMVKREVEMCRCIESEARSLKAEARCIELEFELKTKFKTLEDKLKELESEKISVEKQLKNLKQSNNNVVDLDDQDPIVELMMVNKALECEKQVAESEVEIWKGKFEKLSAALHKLQEMGALRDGEWIRDENVKLGLELAAISLPVITGRKESEVGLARKQGFLWQQQSSDSPYSLTPAKDDIVGIAKSDVSSRGKCRKLLCFEDGGNNTGPSTPNPVIDLSDSDEDEEAGNATVRDSRNRGEKYEDDDMNSSEVNASSLPACKRRRVIRSDSESEDEDNIPIAKLKGLTPQKQERLEGILTTPNADDVETEEESGQSLDGFIVHDTDGSDESGTGESSGDTPDGSDESRTGESSSDESDENVVYAEVISRIRRDKNPGKLKWEYEGEMLADFGKDAELCMRAVCVLYRKQTEDEKASRSTHYLNNRGFSKFDADRGSRLGEFLTDGDPNGDLNKSVEELRRFDAEAVELCRDLAKHYSKQLFQIYKNKEDEFFTCS